MFHNFCARVGMGAEKFHIMMLYLMLMFFFNQWYPSTAKPIVKVCRLQKETILKNRPHLVTFHDSILVS